MAATHWEDHHPEAVLAANRFNAEAFAAKVSTPFYADQIEEDYPDALIVPIAKNELLCLRTDVVSEFSQICFVDATTGKLIAQVKTKDGDSSLTVVDARREVAIDCHLKGKSLHIQSPGKVSLRGVLDLDEDLQVDCQFFHFKSNREDYSRINARGMLVRSAEEAKLDEKVNITLTDKLVCCAEKLENQASVKVAGCALVVNQFVNKGDIKAQEITGYANVFTNEKSMSAEHLMQVFSNSYQDRGETTASILNITSRHVEMMGLLSVSQSARIKAENCFHFGERAQLKICGSFNVQSDGEINFAGKMQHTQLNPDDQFNLITKRELKFNGFAYFTGSETNLVSEESAVSVNGMLSSNENAALYLQGKVVQVNKQLHDFDRVQINAENEINVNDAIFTKSNCALKSKTINVNAKIESKHTIDLKSGTLTLSQDGELLSQEQQAVECDYLHNAGKILSQTGIKAGVNYLTSNLGEMSAPVFDLNTAIFANAGTVCGQKSMTINAFFALSIGLIYAARYQLNTLVDLPLGLQLTSLPEMETVFSLSSLKDCAYAISSLLMPQAIKKVQQVRQFYNELRDWKQTLQVLTEVISILKFDVPLHQIIARLAKLKDKLIAMTPSVQLAKEFYDKRAQHVSGLTGALTEIRKIFEAEGLKSVLTEAAVELTQAALDHVDSKMTTATLKDATRTAVNTVLPASTSYSAARVDAGLQLTAKSDVHTLRMENHGAHATLASLAVEAKTLNYSGTFAAAVDKISLTGEVLHDTGCAFSAVGVGVVFQRIILAAENDTARTNYQIQAEQLIISGHETLRRSIANAGNIVCQANAGLTLESAQVTARDQFEQQQGSQLTATASSISGADVSLHGNSKLYHSTVSADKDLIQTGQLHGSASVLAATNITLSKADLTDGKVAATQGLHLSEVNATTTKLSGKNVDIADSTLRGKKEAKSSVEMEVSAKTNQTAAAPINSEKSLTAEEHLNLQRTQLIDMSIEATDVTSDASELEGSTVEVHHKLTATAFTAKQSSVHAVDVDVRQSTLHQSSVTADKELYAQDVIATEAAVRAHELILEKSAIAKSEVHVAGHLTTREITSSSTIVTAQSAQMHQTQLTENTQVEIAKHLGASNVTITTSRVDAGSASVVDSMVEKNAVLHTQRTLDSTNSTVVGAAMTADGDMTLHGQSSLTRAHIESAATLTVRDHINAQDATVKGHDVLVVAQVKNKGQLHVEAESELTATEESQFDSETLTMKANVFTNYAALAAQSYQLSAARYYNFNSVDVKKDATFNVQQVMINMPLSSTTAGNLTANTAAYINLAANVSANTAKINAGLYANVFGRVNGSDNLTVNALAALNAGLMQSLHTRVTAAVSCNVGIFAPSLPSSWGQLCSWDYLSGAVTTLAYNVAAPIGGAVKLVSTARSAKQTLSAVPSTLSHLYSVATRAISDPRSVNLGEMVGSIVAAKDLVMGASDLYSSAASGLGSVLQGLTPPVAATSSASDQSAPKRSLRERASEYASAMSDKVKEGMVGIGERAAQGVAEGAKMLLPSVSMSTVYCDNSGSVLTGRYSQYACFDAINRGAICAEQATFSGGGFTNSGSVDVDRLTVSTKDYYERGSTYAETAKVSVDRWHQEGGRTEFQGGSVEVRQLFDGQAGTFGVSKSNVQIAGDLVTQQGMQMGLQQSRLHVQGTSTVDGALKAKQSALLFASSPQGNAQTPLDFQSANLTQHGSVLNVSAHGKVELTQSSLQAGELTNAGRVIADQDSSAQAVNYHDTELSDLTVGATAVFSTLADAHVSGRLTATGAGDAEKRQLNVRIGGALVVGTTGQVIATQAAVLQADHAGVAEGGKVNLSGTGTALDTRTASVAGLAVAQDGATLTVREKADVSGELRADHRGQIILADLPAPQEEGTPPDLITHGASLDIAGTGKVNVGDESVLLAGKTINQGELTLKDSVAAVADYRATEQSRTTLTGRAKEGEQPGLIATLTSQQDAKIAGELAMQSGRVSAAKVSEISGLASMQQSTVVGETTRLTGRLKVTDANELQGTKRLDTDRTSQVSGTGSLQFTAPEGALRGGFSAADAVAKIDHLDDPVRDLLYGKRVYQSFQPTNTLSVFASDAIDFDEVLQRHCEIDLTASKIDIHANLDSDQGFYFESTQSDITLHSQQARITSRGTIGLKSAKGIRNHGSTVLSDKDLLLETLDGDLFNRGGVMGGQHYTQAIVNGDVILEAATTRSRHGHDFRQHHQAAQLMGGRRENDDIGLYVKATGRVVNDASVIQSSGHNIVNADKGYEGKARTSERVERHRSEGFWSGEKSVRRTQEVFASSLVSTHGHNLVEADHGDITGAAASFISKEGTRLSASGDIDLRGVQSTDRTVREDYSFFGLIHHKQKGAHQKTTPGLLFDVGVSKIHSRAGSVHTKGVVFLGDGSLEFQGKNVTLEATKDQHRVDSYSRSVGIDFFGAAAISAVVNGRDYVTPLLQLDPTVAKAADLVGSKTPTQFAAGTWNAAVSAYNMAQSFDEVGLMSRYGLGDASGFNPRVSLTFSRSQSHQSYETLGAGGVQRSALTVIADDTVTFSGLPINVSGDASVTAKTFVQEGQKLNAHASSGTDSLSVGFSLRDGVASVGASHQQASSEQTAQHVQQFKVGGNLHLEVETHELDQATVEANTASGHVDQLLMTTRQDTATSNSFSVNASTSGSVGFSVADSSSQTVGQRSDVTIHNAAHSDLSINRVVATGATLNTALDQGVRIAEIERHDVHDHANGSSVGLSTNAMDFIGHGNTAAPSAVIPVATVQVSSNHYSALEHGAVGLNDVQATVLKQDSMDIALDVPLALLTRQQQSVSELTVVAESNNETDKVDDSAPVMQDVEVTTVVALESPNDEVAQTVPVDLADDNSRTDQIIDSDLQLDFTVSFSQRLMSFSDGVLPKSEFTLPTLDHHEMPDREYDPDISFTHMYWKRAGGSRRQLTDAETGRYMSSSSLPERMMEENKQRERFSTAAEIRTTLCDGVTGTLFEFPVGYHDSSINAHPTLHYTFGDATLSTEINLSEGIIATKVAVNAAELRAHVADAHFDIAGMGTAELSCDAANVYAQASAAFSTENGIDAGAKVEVGLLGPNASVKCGTYDFCFFGRTLKINVGASAGIGVKAGAGTAVTLGKNGKARYELRAGLFAGVGGEAKVAFECGIDEEGAQRRKENRIRDIERRLADPLIQRRSAQIRAAREEAETQAATSGWSFLRAWRVTTMQEAEWDLQEEIGSSASSGGVQFSYRRPK